MKKCYTLLLIVLSFTSFSQTENTITELLIRYDNLPQTNRSEDEALDQEFTPQEKNTLLKYFSETNAKKRSRTSNGEMLNLDFFYALNGRAAGNQEFGTLNAEPPFDTFNLIDETFTRLKADDIGPDGKLYAVNRDTFELVTVDLENGSINVVGALDSVFPGDFVAGLSHNFFDGFTYLLVRKSGFSSIFRVNLADASMTLVSNMASTNNFWLVIDNQGNGWTVNANDNTLYKIDLSTGTMTERPNATGRDFNFSQDATYDHENEVLIMAGYEGAGVGGIYTLDTESGIASLVGETTPLEYSFPVFSAINSSLSVDSYDAKNYSLYPNPTNGIINFEGFTVIRSVEVYNNLGQAILNYNSSEYIDLSELQNGNYILKITTNDNQITHHKIIKTQ